MKNKKLTREELISILLKKANGFYFQEETAEYEKTQKHAKNVEKSTNLSKNISFFDNNDMGLTNLQNGCDTIESEDNNESENLVLIKKKIVNHYQPPDMTAIKTLLEILDSENQNNDLTNLSDQELISLKNKLLEEVEVDYKKNNTES